VLSRREFVALMALIPLILNGFSILSSIKGFKSKERIPRPVITDSEGYMIANDEEGAPITLVQLLTLRIKLSEKQIIIVYSLVYLISSSLAIFIYLILT